MTDDLTLYWFCPNDGSHMTEVTRGEGTGGRFDVHMAVLEVAIANAEAVGKLDPNQVEEATNLAKQLLDSGVPEPITLVSVECPSCNSKAVAPLTFVTADENTQKRQIKSVKQVLNAAKRSRRQVGGETSGISGILRYRWYLMIGLSIITFLYSILRSMGVF